MRNSFTNGFVWTLKPFCWLPSHICKSRENALFSVCDIVICFPINMSWTRVSALWRFAFQVLHVETQILCLPICVCVHAFKSGSENWFAKAVLTAWMHSSYQLHWVVIKDWELFCGDQHKIKPPKKSYDSDYRLLNARMGYFSLSLSLLWILHGHTRVFWRPVGQRLMILPQAQI